MTYDEENLPIGNSLLKSDPQKFYKRLRRNLSEIEPDRKIKHFTSGEYGQKFGRAHYHSIIFGLGEEDHDLLHKSWGLGITQSDPVNEATCAYVAGYIQKKLSGPLAEEVYQGRQPPFQLNSNGLGKTFILNNAEQYDQMGYLTQYGVKYGLPKYYRDLMGFDSERAQAYAEEQHQKEVDTFAEMGLDYYDPEAIQIRMMSRKQTEKNITARQDIFEKAKL